MMNNRGLATTTVIMISALAFITTVTLASLMINQFYSTPGNTPVATNDTYSAMYNAVYANTTAQQSSIESIGKPANLFSAGFLAVGAVFTTAIIGIQAIATIATQLPVTIQTMISILSVNPYVSGIFFAFLGSAAVIYIGMKALQAARGTMVEP